ncbi:MAG: GDSL-type esterase/lipase family protein [Patescibacteria group bacterium]
MITVAKLFLFLVLAYAIVAFIRFRHYVRVGTEMAANTLPFQRIAPGAEERILVAGDSSAVGTGARTPEESTAGRLAENHPKAEVINVSKNGLRAKGLLEMLSNRNDLGHFDIAVIQIGGNDINYGTDLVELEKTVRAILERTKELADKVVIMHSSNMGNSPIFPRVIGLYITHRTRLVREMYLRIAPEYGARYADLFMEHKEDIWLTDPDRYYARDKFHPAGPGYELWYEAIQKALRKRSI